MKTLRRLQARSFAENLKASRPTIDTEADIERLGWLLAEVEKDWAWPIAIVAVGLAVYGVGMLAAYVRGS